MRESKICGFGRCPVVVCWLLSVAGGCKGGGIRGQESILLGLAPPRCSYRRPWQEVRWEVVLGAAAEVAGVVGVPSLPMAWDESALLRLRWNA
jgi:hypothetical protein